jgi:hypothetical protein
MLLKLTMLGRTRGSTTFQRAVSGFSPNAVRGRGRVREPRLAAARAEQVMALKEEY